MTSNFRFNSLGFELRGHDCLLGEYPSLAIPVGTLGGKLVAVYAREEGTQFHQVHPDAIFTRHSPVTASLLRGFDPAKHGLFAFNEAELVLYETGKEGEFYTRLLKSSAASSIEPFYRFSLAVETGDLSLIRPLYLRCTKQMKKDAPEFTEMWMRSVKRLNPQLEEVTREWLAPRLEPAFAFSHDFARALPQAVTALDFRELKDAAVAVAAALSRLAFKELNPQILSGDALRSGIRASLASPRLFHSAISPQDAEQIASPEDVAKISRLSLSLLEFYNIILSKAVIIGSVQPTESGRQARPLLREILRPERYEKHFRRHPVKIKKRQVFTYAEVLSLVGYRGDIEWPPWL